MVAGPIFPSVLLSVLYCINRRFFFFFFKINIKHSYYLCIFLQGITSKFIYVTNPYFSLHSFVCIILYQHMFLKMNTKEGYVYLFTYLFTWIKSKFIYGTNPYFPLPFHCFYISYAHMFFIINIKTRLRLYIYLSFPRCVERNVYSYLFFVLPPSSFVYKYFNGVSVYKTFTFFISHFSPFCGHDKSVHLNVLSLRYSLCKLFLHTV